MVAADSVKGSSEIGARRSEAGREKSSNLVLAFFGTARHPPAPYLDHNYEKNCLILNHGVNRHRVCCFLRGKTGNNRNVNNRGNGSLADAYTA
jgi:hypothetical protein